MSTTNRCCKGSLKIIAANQGYKRLLFVPWKAFQDEETAKVLIAVSGSAVYID
jgi:hypothetical protein